MTKKEAIEKLQELLEEINKAGFSVIAGYGVCSGDDMRKVYDAHEKEIGIW